MSTSCWIVPREADLVDVPRPASSISFATTRAVARTEVPRQTSMRKCLDRDLRRQTPLLSRTSGTLRPSYWTDCREAFGH